MKINEIIQPTKEGIDNTHDEELAAISQFLVGRANDYGDAPTMSVQSFIKIANKMGLSLTPETLKDLVASDRLSDVIKDVNDDEIVFHGKQEVEMNSGMTTDKAREVVKKMAKHQLKK